MDMVEKTVAIKPPQNINQQVSPLRGFVLTGEIMRKNTGPKIILIADVLFVLSIVLLVLGGSILVAGLVVLLLKEDVLVLFIAALSMLASALSLYIASLFIRGYGEMVTNSNRLCDQFDLLIGQMSDSEDADQAVYDEVCNAVQNSINCPQPEEKES